VKARPDLDIEILIENSSGVTGPVSFDDTGNNRSLVGEVSGSI